MFVFMSRIRFLACLLVVLLAPTAWAGMGDEVQERVLPNGLKVLLLENHKAPVVTFQVWYRVGSRNEQWGKTGLAHMLEHMMFKGTEKVSGTEFSRIIQEHGGNLNAFTAQDYTAYFENLSSGNLGIAIDLESDRMGKLVLREQDFETELMVVIEERRLRVEDRPTAYLGEQLEATAFQTSPYHWPIIGWMEDLRGLTLEDVKAFYKTYYQPVNAFLVVVGDFQTDELLPKIEQAFGVYPRVQPPNQKKGIDPPQQGERRVLVQREAKLPAVVMGYHVPNLHEPDAYVLEVIAAVLSLGKSSRLYRRLVQESQLALEASADNSLLSRDPDLFYVSATPLAEDGVTRLEEALDAELERLQNEPVSAVELERAKNHLEATFVYSQDSIFYQALLLARFEIASSWRKIDAYLEAVGAVSAADIQRVAKRYLTRRNRTVATLIPQPAAKAAVGGPPPPTTESSSEQKDPSAS